MAELTIQRLMKAVSEADTAFWAVIATHYPEASGGDCDPLACYQFTQAQIQAVRGWLNWNHPDLKDGTKW